MKGKKYLVKQHDITDCAVACLAMVCNWRMRNMSTFVLKREYELAMPTSYVDIDRDEMEYVHGGMTLLVNRSFLNQNYCNRYGYLLVNK